MIKGLLFDLDGVIVNTEPLHCKAYIQVLGNYGIKLSEDEYFEHWVRDGKGIVQYKQKHGLDIDVEKLREEKRDIYHRFLRESLEVITNAPEKVDELSKLYRMALVSSSYRKNINLTMELTGLEKYFEAIVSCYDDVKKPKPAPDGFLFAVKRLGLQLKECVVIEDAEKGIISAVNAGIKSIAIPTIYTKDNDFSKADKVIKDISELTQELINSL